MGEDRVGHTPKDETVNLKIGNAFDVVRERTQTDFQKIAPNVYEMEFDHTAEPQNDSVTVEVNEPVGEAFWRILQSSHKYTKTAAFAAQFMVPVPAGGEAVLKYRIRVTV